jgi:hypothetical protein
MIRPTLRRGRVPGAGIIEPVQVERNVMRNAASASSVNGTPETGDSHRSGPGILVVMLAELRRALAATRRYEHLRYRSACAGRVAPADIPRQLFEEFYSSKEVVKRRPLPAACRPAQAA